MAGMQDSECPAPADAGDAIARLRQRVQVLIDGDKVLPVDGSFLLMALDQALEGLSGTGEPAGLSAIETFMRRVQGLMEAGVLAAADGQPPIEAAAVLAALIPSAGGTGG